MTKKYNQKSKSKYKSKYIYNIKSKIISKIKYKKKSSIIRGSSSPLFHNRLNFKIGHKITSIQKSKYDNKNKINIIILYI